MAQLTSKEKETVIVFNEYDKEAEVFTYNGRMLKALENMVQERPDEVQRIKTNDEGASTYRLPKKWVKIRASRILTEEEKKRVAEMGRNSLKSNLAKNINAEQCVPDTM